MANVLGELFGDIAAAIRAKTGDAEKMKPAEFPEKISSIETSTGVDVSGVTATAADVLEGKTIVNAEGNKVDGTMPNNVSKNAYLDQYKNSYKIAKGYHDGNGRVSVSSTSRTIIPTKDRQYALDPSLVTNAFLTNVTVEPIPDYYTDVSNVTATAGDVRSGKVFVDADGNEVEGALSGTIADVSDVTANAEDVLEGKVIVTSTGSKVYGALAVDNLNPGEVIVYKKKKVGGFALDSTFGAYTPGFVYPSEFVLEEGKSYRVNWDGVDYECVSFSFPYSGVTFHAVGNASSMGLPGNGEPFLITYGVDENVSQIFSLDDKDAHTVGIYTEATSEILLQEKTVTENGVVEPDEGYDGLGKVTVDVQSGGGASGLERVTILPQQTITPSYDSNSGAYCFEFTPTEKIEKGFAYAIYCDGVWYIGTVRTKSGTLSNGLTVTSDGIGNHLILTKGFTMNMTWKDTYKESEPFLLGTSNMIYFSTSAKREIRIDKISFAE